MDSKEKVLEYLNDNISCSTKSITVFLNISSEETNKLLNEMANENLIYKDLYNCCGEEVTRWWDKEMSKCL
jgi:beta-lactamase class D